MNHPSPDNKAADDLRADFGVAAEGIAFARHYRDIASQADAANGIYISTCKMSFDTKTKYWCVSRSPSYPSANFRLLVNQNK